MKYEQAFAKLGCFTRKDVCRLTGNDAAAHSLLYDYTKNGLIYRIRRNLYVAVDSSTGLPIAADRFLIASHISDDSYVTHHSAFEYYGCYNQVYNWIFTSGEHYYKPFIFDFTEYHYHVPHIYEGIIHEQNGVNVTDLERTVLDSISDFEKISGLEELLKCMELVPPLDEEKLLKYLPLYHRPFLYQKTGFLLEKFKDQFHLSAEFFERCQKHCSSSKRYLERTASAYFLSYDPKWKLYAPDLDKITAKGIEPDTLV